MTRSDNGAQQWTGEAGDRPPFGAAQLFPKVTFGLGAAVLAGVMVVSVPAVAPAAYSAVPPATARLADLTVLTTTVGLGAVINAIGGIAAFETTCCA